jgi:hypothetical protein
MSTTISGKQIATTKSGHTVVTPPAISNIPPMAPPTPPGVPAPFPYMGRSATAKKTSSKLKIGGGETLINGSTIDVDPPGNQPSQPAPIHDIVTMQVKTKFYI